MTPTVRGQGPRWEACTDPLTISRGRAQPVARERPSDGRLGVDTCRGLRRGSPPCVARGIHRGPDGRARRRRHTWMAGGFVRCRPRPSCACGSHGRSRPRADAHSCCTGRSLRSPKTHSSSLSAASSPPSAPSGSARESASPGRERTGPCWLSSVDTSSPASSAFDGRDR